MPVPRALTIATSDSGGGAGIQADLKAFAAAGAHGMSALVALTAQNTAGMTAIQELPPEFVLAQLDAVFEDIGVDAAKTGMLFSRRLSETVAGYLEEHRVAAEDAAVGAEGPGTFHARLYDAPYGLGPGTLDGRANIEEV